MCWKEWPDWIYLRKLGGIIAVLKIIAILLVLLIDAALFTLEILIVKNEDVKGNVIEEGDKEDLPEFQT